MVTTTLIVHNRELREQFNQCYLTKSKDADVQSEAVNSVFNEFTRKLCNTRLNEYLESLRRTMVASTGGLFCKESCSSNTVVGCI